MAFSLIMSRREEEKTSLQERLLLLQEELQKACRIIWNLATWIPCVTGATPRITWSACGWFCSTKLPRILSSPPASSTPSGTLPRRPLPPTAWPSAGRVRASMKRVTTRKPASCWFLWTPSGSVPRTWITSGATPPRRKPCWAGIPRRPAMKSWCGLWLFQMTFRHE